MQKTEFENRQLSIWRSFCYALILRIPTQGTIKLKDLNQATKSAEMENYELEFRQNLKTKIECLAISNHRKTDT